MREPQADSGDDGRGSGRGCIVNGIAFLVVLVVGLILVGWYVYRRLPRT